MMKRAFKKDLLILLSCFVASRLIVKVFGVSFGFNALYEYWQYLDVESLSGNLLQSLWYQHSQPPVFNLLLGIVLKCSGNEAQPVLQCLLLAISFFNGFFLLRILRSILNNRNLPIIISLLYILSPATILYENELFYTSSLSLLLLLAIFYLVKFNLEQSWRNAIGVFVCLSLLCLTKSAYHLLWLILTSAIFLFAHFRKSGFKKMVCCALLSVSLVAAWYFKNYFIFGNFSASSWTGMNFARIVFQNVEIKDTGNIASVHPFLPISYYKKFTADDYIKKYAGLNDRILLKETKNDHFINMNNAGFLEVSRTYMDASKRQVMANPYSYLKNFLTSMIIYFTPASSYYKLADNSYRIRYYDMIYSLNAAHLFQDEQQKKKALAISGIPMLFLYGFVFFILIKTALRFATLPLPSIFIGTTILFTLVVSSLFEYGENMRFRYEVQPIFLILAAQALEIVKNKATVPRHKK